MKTINKLQFGLSAVQAGQKTSVVNAAPQLIANSTHGKFVITSAVSKKLCIAVGDTVMFLNNIREVETAILQRNPDLVAYATENNIDIDSREGQDAILNAFTQWFIAKGVKRFDKAGAPVMVSERFTKEDKIKYLKLHAMEIVAANRDAFVDQFGEMSDEELAAQLTPEMVEAPKVQDAEGSKTSTTSSATGVGCQLNFTDSSIWTALKADLGEDMNKKNRVFTVDLDNCVNTNFFDGYKTVEVVAAPIEFKEDVNPIIRTKKDETEVAK